MPTPPLLLSYVRKSVITDEKTASPARQREAIARVTPPGWENRWYEDLDYSGTTSARPDWQRLLADLQDPALNIGGVAAESLSRLYRNRSEFETLKALIARRDCELLLGNMAGVDGRRASGRLLLNLQADIDQFWAEQTSESMRETIATIQAGGRHFGTPPFATGRDPVTKHLVASDKTYLLDATGRAWRADDQDAPATAERRHYFDALMEMFTLYGKGTLSFEDVSRALNAGGWYFWSQDLMTPKPFTRQAVRSVLQRWNVYGLSEMGAASAPPQRRNRRPAAHGAILPAELCERVGAIYQKRAREKPQGHSNRSEHVYLLTGVLFCGRCGSRMCGQHCSNRRDEKFYYRHIYSKAGCLERITPASALESAVTAALVELVGSEAILADVIAELKTIYMLAQQESNGPAWQLEAKERELSRLAELFTKRLTRKRRQRIWR